MGSLPTIIILGGCGSVTVTIVVLDDDDDDDDDDDNFLLDLDFGVFFFSGSFFFQIFFTVIATSG